MPWTTLICLGLTFTFWRLTQNYSDEVIGFLGSLATATFLIIGLAAAPILLKSLILLLLLLAPSFVVQRRNFS